MLRESLIRTRGENEGVRKSENGKIDKRRTRVAQLTRRADTLRVGLGSRKEGVGELYHESFLVLRDLPRISDILTAIATYIKNRFTLFLLLAKRFF